MYKTIDAARLDAFDFDLLATNFAGSTFSINQVGKLRLDMMGDDFSNDTSTTGVVNVGGSTMGVFEIEGDEDWFAVTLTAGDYFEFSYNNILDFIAGGFYDSTGTQITSVDTFQGIDEEYIGFDVTTTGTYFVSVSDTDFGTIDRSYSFFANVYTSDDHGNDITTTSMINLGGSTSGNLEYVNDQDWFEVSLTAGEQFTVNTNVFMDELDVSLRDASGAFVGTTSLGFDDAGFTYLVTNSGIYYVAVASGFMSPAPNTAFTLNAMTGPPDLAADISTTGTIAVGGSTIGNFDFENDADWFAFTLTGDQIIDFSVSQFTQDVTVFDAAGNFVSGSSFTDNHTFSGSAGDYFVGVTGDFGQTGPYTLTATEIVDDFAGDISTTGTIAVGDSTTGSFDFENDADWFAFTLTGDQVVDFALSVFAQEITVFDSSGNFVSGINFDDNHIFTGSAGDYFVGVTGDFGQTGPYTLTASEIIDDFAGNISTTGTIAVGGSTTGNFDFENDADWFAFTLTRDQIVNFSVSQFTQNVTIFDSAGNFVSGSSGTDSHIFSGSAGDYFVGTTGDFIIGPYTLTASEIVDDFAGDLSTLGMIAVGDVIRGSIDFDNDQDWFAFTGFSGQSITIRQDAVTMNDPFLRLLDSAGNEIASNDDFNSLSSQIDFTFTVNGTYYISAQPLGGLDIGTYDLSVTGDIFGTRNSDVLSGTTGDDIIYALGDDDIVNGLSGNDTVFGGAGNDTLNGNGGNDVLTGQAGNDILDGGIGADTLNGNAGDDTISGGNQSDTINGGGGADIIDGGLGNDDLRGAIGFDTINGDDGADIVSGGRQDDTINGDAGNDTLNGDAGNDIISGGDNNDTLIGASGRDTLNGDAGNDNLSGDSGGDDLFGGAGDDILNGGGDNDDLNGGAGADIFVANLGFRTDRIKDFEDGTDMIDFSGNVLANDFADVMAAATQVGANVRIDLNANNALILEGFNLADLDASDFIF